MNCVICGKEISKRQSYAYNEGRACKEHKEAQEEVINKRTEAKDEVRNSIPKRERMLKKMKERNHHREVLYEIFLKQVIFQK